MRTWRSTKFFEVWGSSPTEHLANESSAAEKSLVVYWGDDDSLSLSGRQQAARDFLGYSLVQVDGAGNKYVSRVTPHYHADYTAVTGSPYMWCESLDGEPLGIPLDADGNPQAAALQATLSSADTSVYEYARFKASYTTREYLVLDDNDPAMPKDANGNPDESSLARYISLHPKPAGKFVIVPRGVLNFDLGGGTFKLAVGQTGATEQFSGYDFTWHQVPKLAVGSLLVNHGLALPALDLCQGRVNGSAVWGFPAGTLLMDPCELKPYWNPHGERIFDIVFHFKFKTAGHNSLLYSAAVPARYFPVQRGTGAIPTEGTAGLVNTGMKADGYRIYDEADFTLMFKVPS